MVFGVISIFVYIKQSHNMKFILFESFSVDGKEKEAPNSEVKL